MHSTVYQITKERVIEGNFLNEDTLTQGTDGNIDYCSDIDATDRKWRIDNLVNTILPKGMFTQMENDTIRYNGGIEAWKAEWVKRIQEKANLVTPANVTEWIGATYHLKTELENPFGTGSLFYTDEEGVESCANESGDFMAIVNELKEGEHLYIGGVIDYYY